MARVTTEDCIDIVPNRFELVVLAAQRARSIANGSPLLVERDNDKDPVVALREIAERAVTPDTLRTDAIEALQHYVQRSEPQYDDTFSVEDRHIRAWRKEEETI